MLSKKQFMIASCIGAGTIRRWWTRRHSIVEGAGVRVRLEEAAFAAKLPPAAGRGSVERLGHSTVLLQVAGFTVLTDPCALPELAEKPDVVLLSHLHPHHFDDTALNALDAAVPIVSPRAAARALAGKGFSRAYALDPWHSMTFLKQDTSLHVTALPARHAPGILNAFFPPVMGSMLDFETADGRRLLRVYVSGDTVMHDDLYDIPHYFADVNLALLHLGRTDLGRLFRVNLDDREAVELLDVVAPRTVIPIHYEEDAQLEDFRAAAHDAGFRQWPPPLGEEGPSRLVILGRGERHTFALRAQPAQASAAFPHAPTRIAPDDEATQPADVELPTSSDAADLTGASAAGATHQYDGVIGIPSAPPQHVHRALANAFDNELPGEEIHIEHRFIAISGTEPPVLAETPPGWDDGEALNELVLHHGERAH